MQNMQTFYAQLCSSANSPNPYLSYLFQLTRLSPSAVASLKTVLWWNDWSSPPE